MLLNKSTGFSVGPSINPCTKGLWMYNKPIYKKQEDGTILPIYIIDTEGFGAFDEDTNHDIRIFTLAILLSSYFIYNSVGTIDESAIRNLSFVINLSKHIQIEENMDTDHAELSKYFPSFLWVLRDFSLKLEDENGEEMTPKEYLEHVLDYEKNSGSSDDSKHKIRKLIKTYFKDRDCSTLIRPMSNEKSLQDLASVDESELRPEFLTQILNLRKKVISRVKHKTFKGTNLDGAMFVNIIKSLTEAINTGKMPSIKNTWDNLCEYENNKAFMKGEMLYEQIFKNEMEKGIKADVLEEIHERALRTSITEFNLNALGEASKEQKKILKSKIKQKFTYFAKLVEETEKSDILKEAEDLFSAVEENLYNGNYDNIEQIEEDFEEIKNRINEKFPESNQKQEIIEKYKSKILKIASDKLINDFENRLNLKEIEFQQKLSNLSKKYEDEKAMQASEINRIINQIQGLKEEMKNKEVDIKNSKQKISEIEKSKQDVEFSFKEELKKTTQELEQEKELIEKEVNY